MLSRALPVCTLYLQLSERETTASAHTTIVFDRRTANDGPQSVGRPGCHLGSLFLAGIAARLLLARLYRDRCQDIGLFMHYRRHCSQGNERGFTWSKCTRTRRCQSFRKSAKILSAGVALTTTEEYYTVAGQHLVVLDCHLVGIVVVVQRLAGWWCIDPRAFATRTEVVDCEVQISRCGLGRPQISAVRLSVTTR